MANTTTTCQWAGVRAGVGVWLLIGLVNWSGCSQSTLMETDPVVPPEEPPAELVPTGEGDPAGMPIVIGFTDSCSHLQAAAEAPEDLTLGGFVECLTPEARDFMATGYARHLGTLPEAPPDLDGLVAEYGDTPIQGISLRDLFPIEDRRAEEIGAGLEPDLPDPNQQTRALGSGYGFATDSCHTSCISRAVPVVSAWRTIAYSPRASGALPPSPSRGRLFDDILYGTFPDFDQDDLSSSALRDAGCGPVAAINMFEWWNIPVYRGSSQLTTFDSQAIYIADAMDTLDGIDFTDDGELLDFMKNYPRTAYAAGHTSGYPGYHYMRGDRYAWKIMMNYLSQGYPVLALYATSSSSLHWALITGHSDGLLRIANAGDRTPTDFYNRWDHWSGLSWYAEIAADAWVEPQTFFAYTGWDESKPAPLSFAIRDSDALSPPAYDGRGFRYCTGTGDGLSGAEDDRVGFWSEPSTSAGTLCLFNHDTPTVALPDFQQVPVTLGGRVELSIPSEGVSEFAAANPAGRCRWFGWSDAAGKWTRLRTKTCDHPDALHYSFTHNGTYQHIRFTVHAADFAAADFMLIGPGGASGPD